MVECNGAMLWWNVIVKWYGGMVGCNVMVECNGAMLWWNVIVQWYGGM